MEFQGNAPGSREAFRLLRAQLLELCGVCTALSDSTDLANLWRRIVRNAQIQLNVDGCTYYRIADRQLHFEVVLSASLGILSDAHGSENPDFEPIPLFGPDDTPNLRSLAARAAHEGAPINVPNVERIPGYDRSHTREFDQRMGYRTHSLLTVPVRFQSEPVTGVLQFVNAKNGANEVVEFDDHREAIAGALASLIAVASRLR